MPSILRYSTPYSEPWVAWTMVVLLLLLLSADFFQRGLLVGSFRSILATKERESLFSEVVKTTAGSICMFIYEVGIVALALYSVLFENGHFSFLTYLIIVLMVVALTGIKYLLMWFVSYVFLDKQAFPLMTMHYSNLSAVVCTLLYPVVLLVLFAPFVGRAAAVVMLSVIAVFALFIWLLKAFRLFFTNLLAGLYIFLYLCTLEIIPLAGMIFICEKLI